MGHDVLRMTWAKLAAIVRKSIRKYKKLSNTFEYSDYLSFVRKVKAGIIRKTRSAPAEAFAYRGAVYGGLEMTNASSRFTGFAADRG